MSNYKEIIHSPEFKAWFGDWENNPERASKVVDRNGKPLVVYHGSSSNFSTFDFSRGGYSCNGSFFTASKELAESFTHGGKLYPVFLFGVRPLVINMRGATWEDVPTGRKAYYPVEIITESDGEKEVNRLDKDYGWHLQADKSWDLDYYYSLSKELINQQLEKYGKEDNVTYAIRRYNETVSTDTFMANFVDREKYDMIILKNIAEFTEYKEIVSTDYIVLNSPNQIKSINNIGSFSKKSNNIYEGKKHRRRLYYTD